MNKNKLEVELSMDGDHYVRGDHITIEQAQKLMGEYDDELIVTKVTPKWYRFGFLPQDIQEEEHDRGWWIVEKQGKGAGKITHLETKSKQ